MFYDYEIRAINESLALYEEEAEDPGVNFIRFISTTQRHKCSVVGQYQRPDKDCVLQIGSWADAEDDGEAYDIAVDIPDIPAGEYYHGIAPTFTAENIKNTFSAFGIELPEDAAVPLTTVSGRGPFAAFTYFRTYDPETMKGMTTGYGITDDGILYLGFSGFDFYSYFETRNEFTEDVTSFLSGLSKAIDDNPEGIIIDMRGNGGGYIVDLDILLPDFLEKGVAAEFAISRRKLGDNRLDYGPWLPLCVYSNERSSFDKSIPIAVLTNKGSVSAAEMTTFFFKALHDEYGYDVTVVGGTTLGGHGSLVSNENELNGGSFNLSSHMVSSYTPSTEIRYIDGISREGNGIEPDVSVPFDYDEYINRKNDIRFNMALKIIREKL